MTTTQQYPSGVLSPAALAAGSTDNYAPTGWLQSIQTLRLTPNAAGSTLTGLTEGAPGRVVRLFNLATATASVIILANDTVSTAANRFLCPFNTAAGYVIQPQCGVDLWYDVTASRWRVLDAAVPAERITVTTGSNQVLTTATPLAVNFTIENFKYGITHDNAVNPDQITIITPGFYLATFSCEVAFSGTFGTSREAIVAFTVNGANVRRSRMIVTTNTTTALQPIVSQVMSLAVGDVVRGVVTATFGGSDAAATQNNTNLSIWMSLHRQS